MNSNLNQRTAPLFVVGMNGSGTTMMLDHLGHHPELFAYPLETYILPYFLQTEHKYGDLQSDANFLRLWNDIRSSYVFRSRNAGRSMALPEDWSNVPRSVAGIFDRIMRIFAEREGKRRWSEKTPMHVLHIDRLAAAFPESQFIHMVRDGRDCAASDHRRWNRHPASTIYRWKSVVFEGRRQGQLIGDRYLELRYEAVTHEPDYYMRLACEFAGLPYNERVLETKRPRQRVIGHDAKTIVKNLERNKGYFSRKRLQSLERIAGRRLTEMGYKTEFYNGDDNPGLVVRWWWSIHDTCRVTFQHLRMKYTGQQRMTWRLLFQRWKMIIQSKISHRRVKAR